MTGQLLEDMHGVASIPDPARHPRDDPERDWRGASSAELIDHILARYHDSHRRQLPELIELAHRVERVHAGRADCPRGLAAHLERMHEDLVGHMRKEELVLFPMLRHGHPPVVRGPIAVMRGEHEQHHAALERMAALTGGFRTPDGACGSWRALMAGARRLHDDLVQHIALENGLLFEPGSRQAAGCAGSGSSCGCAAA